MKELKQKYYPGVLQAIHLLILYIFIQTIVDFPLAMIDYYKDSEYLYHPVKKIILGLGSTIFILYYGFKKSKLNLNDVFPIHKFNLLLILPVITFLWGTHNILEIINSGVEKLIPPPTWFWELFNKIFESDFGWWGAFFKIVIIAPVVEELIFRGVILSGFRRNYSPVFAVFMSALLFALFHLNPWQFPATFILGLLLGWIMIRTSNIFMAILGHSINNFLVLATITWFDKIQHLSIYSMNKSFLYLISIAVISVSLILIYVTSYKKRKI